MGRRYEANYGHSTPAYVVLPEQAEDHDLDEVFFDEWVGADVPEADRRALVIGDPYASAYAIVGSVQELRTFAWQLVDLVEREIPIT